MVHREARQLISSVVEKCDEESARNTSQFPLKQATKRAAYYCGKLENFIKRIRKEHRLLEQIPGSTFSTPGKTWYGVLRILVEDFD